MIKIKRVYDEVEKDDGIRILVDRLWPRGLKKDSVKIDKWFKDVAPRTALENGSITSRISGRSSGGDTLRS